MPIDRTTNSNSSMDRRVFLKAGVFGLAGVGLGLLTACQPSAPPAAPTSPPATTAPVPTAAPAAAAPAASPAPSAAPAAAAASPAVVSKPTSGQTLTMALESNLSTLDIQDAQAFTDGLAMGLNVYDRLFEQSPQGLKPGLAERWETSADGKTWTFHLRSGVKFHDGTPLTAKLVKESIDRVTDTSLKLRQAGKYQGVVSAEASDDSTLKIQTDKPIGALPGNLTHQSGGSVELASAASQKKFGIGTGPFKLVEYVPDDRLVLDANKDYWGGAPGVDRIVFRIVPEARTRLSMLQAGEVQVIYNLAPNEIPGLRADSSYHVEVPPSSGWRFYGFNNQKKPFDDKRVRQALNYAVDKETIVRDILKGVGYVADSPFGPGMFGYVSTFKYAYDPAKAKQLLSDAGYSNGFKTSLLISPSEIVLANEVAAAVQAYFQAVGVQADIQSLEQAVWLGELTKPLDQNKVEIFEYQYGGADPDALRLTLHSGEWPPKRNAAFYKNPQVDSLLDEAATTADQSKRADLYKQVQQVVMDDAPWLFISDWAHADAWRSNVKGVTYLLQDIGLIDLRKASIG